MVTGSRPKHVPHQPSGTRARHVARRTRTRGTVSPAGTPASPATASGSPTSASVPPPSPSAADARDRLADLGVYGFGLYEPIILAALVTEDPLLLIGASGTGKTYLLNTLSEALGLEHRHYNASLISFDDLVGFPYPDPTNAGVTFLQTPATVWGAESVLIDEIKHLPGGRLPNPHRTRRVCRRRRSRTRRRRIDARRGWPSRSSRPTASWATSAGVLGAYVSAFDPGSRVSILV